MNYRINKILKYILPIILLILFSYIFTFNQTFTENIFTQKIFYYSSIIISFPFKFFNLPLFEIIIFLLFIAFVILIILKIRKNIKIFVIIKFLYFIFLISLFLFVMTCSPNYNRLKFSQLNNMKLEKSSSQELYTLSEYLLINAINERNKISLENNNYYYLKEEFYDTSKKALNYYNNLCNFYPFIKEVYVKPKKLFMSEIMSNQGITGFYSCFTMEPIINGNMPDIDVPFSMCHELSHTSGFMREDEANYISYLACINSNDPYFSYSGYLSALNMCASKLYSSNYELFCKLYNSYTNEIKMDNNLSNLYWDKYLEKETAKIHDKVNDVYLKINNQSSGVQSYGEMVDLLLADFKSKI